MFYFNHFHGTPQVRALFAASMPQQYGNQAVIAAIYPTWNGATDEEAR
jgi:hypothetical protein